MQRGSGRCRLAPADLPQRFSIGPGQDEAGSFARQGPRCVRWPWASVQRNNRCVDAVKRRQAQRVPDLKTSLYGAMAMVQKVRDNFNENLNSRRSNEYFCHTGWQKFPLGTWEVGGEGPIGPRRFG